VLSTMLDRHAARREYCEQGRIGQGAERQAPF
jgi:hypothetical protein